MTKKEKIMISDTADKIIDSLTELDSLQVEELNYEARRKLQQAIQRLVKKNKLHVENIINTEEEVKSFILNVSDEDNPIKQSFDGVKLSVKFLKSSHSQNEVNLQPRSYQREKVADVKWKQEIIKTLIIDESFKIPAVHIRILRNDEQQIIGYEVADGQQRLTAIFDFIDGEFSLPDDETFGDYAKCNFSSLKSFNNDVALKILNYPLTTVFYDYFSDEDIAKLFIKILNNVNDMNVQEKNNAVRSELAEFVRYTSRNGGGTWTDTPYPFHELFTRVTENKGAKNKKTKAEVVTRWKYFSTLKLGRMEGDMWLAQLIYLLVTGWRKGVTESKVANFYETTAVSTSNKLGANFKSELRTDKYPKLETKINDLLKVGLEFSKYVVKTPDLQPKKYLKHNFLLFIIMYYNEQKKFHNSGLVNKEQYFKQMIALFDHFDDKNNYELYEDGTPRHQANESTALGAFSSLWGSFNKNVIETVLMLIGERIVENPDFGFTEIDERKTFPKQMIRERLKENGGVDDYTGLPLSENDAVGDHDIPRSWGVEKGGVTEKSNLKVTTEYHNLRKLNMSGDQYIDMLMLEKNS